MANPWAGEVAIVLNGERHVMRLTLGALAELEDALGEASLVDLIARFEKGAVSSSDVLHLVAAGLRGGGWTGTARDLLAVEIGGGPMRAAQLAGQLLVRAFQMPGAE
ncbi:MAG: gene transfer agent family protein [Pseudomonadota bacterium]